MGFTQSLTHFLKLLDRRTIRISNPFGLDISDFSIEVMEVKSGWLKPELISYGRQELEPGVVEDGVIFKKDKLVESIKKALETASPKRMRGDNCVLSLPESKVFTYVFNVPLGLKPNQIKKVLKYEVERVIPLSFNEIYFNFLIVSKNRKEFLQEVFFVGTPKKIVDDFYEVLRKAEIHPLAFDMESAALARSLIERYNIGVGIMIADIGARTTILSIFDKGGVRLTFNFPVAGNKFTESLAKELKISLEEAETLKKTAGLNSEKVSKVLKPQIQMIAEEIKKSIKYYETHSENKIEEIILAGGSSLLLDLDKYLADELGLKVKIGNPLLKVKDSSGLTEKKNSVLFATVLGLALRAATKDPRNVGINLFPWARWHEKKIF